MKIITNWPDLTERNLFINNNCNYSITNTETKNLQIQTQNDSCSETGINTSTQILLARKVSWTQRTENSYLNKKPQNKATNHIQMWPHTNTPTMADPRWPWGQQNFSLPFSFPSVFLFFRLPSLPFLPFPTSSPPCRGAARWSAEHSNSLSGSMQSPAAKRFSGWKHNIWFYMGRISANFACSDH